jgi:hypothetical protein
VILLCTLYGIIYVGFNPRYAIAAVPLVAYFLVRGIDIIVSHKKLKPFLNQNFIFSIVLLIALALAFSTFKKNRYFIFTLSRIEQCDTVGAILNSLPKDGIITDGLLGNGLVYNCDKRIVTLPRSSVTEDAQEQTDLAIQVFDLHYVLVSEFWRIEELPYPAIAYIKNNPDKFKLIKIAYEEYDRVIPSNALIRADIFYIYEINRNKFNK